MNVDAWQKPHGETISNFLKYLYGRTDSFILKGGTALMKCYGLDRFSEDIDLDGKDKTIDEIVNDFCKKQGFTFRTAKDTDTVKRFMIDYGNAGKPLKVEISYRRKDIDQSETNKINGITVYKINELCTMKANAYSGRDKIRDLYDLSFICNNYWDKLSPPVKSFVRNAIEFKGIEQFDYLIKNQSDELIDNDKLAEDFLKMYDRVGLLPDEQEQQIINETLTREVNEKNQRDVMTLDEWKKDIDKTKEFMNNQTKELNVKSNFREDKPSER